MHTYILYYRYTEIYAEASWQCEVCAHPIAIPNYKTLQPACFYTLYNVVSMYMIIL